MSWWLKAVPWSVILANAPALMDGVRKLIDKRKSSGESFDPGDEVGMASRVAALEQRERRMLEIIESLANNTQQLIETVDALRRRARVGLGISVVLAVGLVIALVGAYGS